MPHCPSHPSSIRSWTRFVPLLLLPALMAASARASVPCAGGVSGSGHATLYTFPSGSGGACAFGGDDPDTLVAAINAPQFDGSAMCGRWLRVTGPLGSVNVRVSDQCPDCPVGDLDLNRVAFAKIGNPDLGRVPVSWETVAGPESPTVSLKIQEGSSPWWMALQVRWHRYGIAKLEYLGPSGYVTAIRENYNYFAVYDGITSIPLSSPFTVRLTDVNGQQLVIADVPLNQGATYPTNDQFPLCTSYTSTAPLPDAGRLVMLPPSPNPFNPRTTMVFELPARDAATLRVFTADGRLVATLLDSVTLDAGRHAAEWDGRDAGGRAVAGGQYLMRLESGGRTEVQKAMLLK